MAETNYSYPGVNLRSSLTRGSSIEAQAGDVLRLTIPSGPAGSYRLAQLDDMHYLPRRKFYWQSPVKFSLRARVSDANQPGTWGFGLWNDPFGSLGFGGGSRQFPVFPNAAWFFHASEMNHLTLQDDQPGSGFLTAVFSSLLISPLLLAPSAIFLPLLIWPGGRSWLRRLARPIIRDDSIMIQVDETIWHDYQLICQASGLQFLVDGQKISELKLSPKGQLGLVIWIDNQYAAFTPTGQLRYGTQENLEPAWLEISSVNIQRF